MRLAFTIVVFVLLATGVWVYQSFSPTEPTGPAEYLLQDSETEGETTNQPNTTTDAPMIEVVANRLNIPWEVLFLPDGELLVTERPGTLLILRQGVEIPIAGVEHVGEGGLLGAALHPDYEENNLIYLYQTTASDNGLINRIVRYRLDGTDLALDRIIVDNIPGARYHDGGRIIFGPDGHLYVTIGDATDEDSAQNLESIAGSILRYTKEGGIPADNPFTDSPIYSYGHRNPQGLTWDENGQLWSTEHGRSGVLSGFDELNRIVVGANYGWPESQGDAAAEGTIAPVRHSGSNTTWAPGGLAFHNGSLYIPGLRGQTLYEAVLEGGEISAWYEHLVGEYGRLRSVSVGPDGLLYVTTSNRDGRTDDVNAADDRLLRINPAQLTR